MSSNERLFDFQAITDNTVQLLFTAFSPNAVVTGFSPMNGGMSTSNYVVHLKDHSSKFVLRLYPADNDHSQLEVAAYHYAKPRIHVPEIYYLDNSKQLIPNSFLIMEFIEGLTFREFIAANQELPADVLHAISASLALLHQTEYPRMGLLDGNLHIQSDLEPIKDQYHTLLNSHAGTHIQPSTKEKTLGYLQNNPGLLKTIANRHVFSHGDFIFSNLMITPTLQPFFIDFEYCFSAPMFYDIGKFFRSRAHVEKYTSPAARNTFERGYNSTAKEPLPSEWYACSKMADIATMLHLINKLVIPEGWGDDIDREIVRNLNLLLAY